MIVPEGESGWMVLLDDKKGLPSVSIEGLNKALSETEEKWKSIMKNILHEGVYKDQMYHSYKAIQMVTHEYSGGSRYYIVAGTDRSRPQL